MWEWGCASLFLINHCQWWIRIRASLVLLHPLIGLFTLSLIWVIFKPKFRKLLLTLTLCFVFLQPLFLYLPFQAVHAPLQVPAYYKEPFKKIIKDNKRLSMAGMLSCLDEAIDNITNTLKETGMYDNTIIIFSTGESRHLTMEIFERFWVSFLKGSVLNLVYYYDHSHHFDICIWRLSCCTFGLFLMQK